MAVEQVARWPWNAWPDERGLGGRMAWNPQPLLVGSGCRFESGTSRGTGSRRSSCHFRHLRLIQYHATRLVFALRAIAMLMILIGNYRVAGAVAMTMPAMNLS